MHFHRIKIPCQDIVHYSDIGVIDESFDEIEYLPSKSFSKVRSLVKQPMLLGILLTLFISLLYSRNRFGSLSGGALAVAPASAFELISSYLSSWHLVGLGSSAAAPAWIPIVGIASFATAANPQSLIAALFFLTPTLLFILTYRTARRYSLTRYSSFFVAFIYALSPVTLTAINQGRIGTIVIALLLPGLFTLLEKRRGLGNLSWRKIFSITLIAAVAGAFSSLFLLMWILFHLALFIYTYFSLSNWRTRNWQQVLKNLDADEFKKRAALIFTPILINVPISINLLLNPVSAIREPGLSIESANLLSILLFNPGGPSSPALFILAPFVLYLIIGLISKDQRNSATVALFAILLAGTLSSYYIAGNSSSAQRIYSGPLIVFAQLLTLLSVFAIAERILPQLKRSNFGFKHIASALTSILKIFIVTGKHR